MVEVSIIGWVPGAKTVSAIKLIREQAHVPLDQALAVMNRVLKQELVTLYFSSKEEADRFAAAITACGLITELGES